MHLITYISQSVIPQNSIELELKNIVKVAKSENKKHGITGVLFFHDGNFLQVIEGKEENLRSLMHNIEADPRHKDVDYLIDTPVSKRGFSDWNMDSFQLGAGKIFDRPTLRQITDNYKKNLLPHSQSLIFMYHTLLKEVQTP